MKIFLASLLLALQALPGLGLEGTWKLVEQRYEGGANNLANLDQPLRLEFSREGSRLIGKVWAGDAGILRLDWPAFPNEQGPLPLEIVELANAASGSKVRAHYRVKPSPTDDLVLDVVESYELVEGGAALVGSMTVKFTGGERNRGSFVLHRRFERER